MKFYREFMERTLLYLLYAKDNGMNANEIWRWANRTWYRAAVDNFDHGHPDTPPREVIERVRHILDNDNVLYGEDARIDEMIGRIVEQLDATDGSGAGESNSTLIDKMVAALQETYGRNILSGKTLEALRKALLLPSESDGLYKRLAAKEMSCANCGHGFIVGEMGAFVADKVTNGTATFMVYCTKCYKPSLMACDGDDCKHAAAFPTSVQRHFRKPTYCVACQEARKNGRGLPRPVQPIQPGQPTAEQATDRNRVRTTLTTAGNGPNVAYTVDEGQYIRAAFVGETPETPPNYRGIGRTYAPVWTEPPWAIPGTPNPIQTAAATAAMMLRTYNDLIAVELPDPPDLNLNDDGDDDGDDGGANEP